jgi:hypothetical protein
LGFTGRITQIHGAMDYLQRQDQVDFFRKPTEGGGAIYMICTDAQRKESIFSCAAMSSGSRHARSRANLTISRPLLNTPALKQGRGEALSRNPNDPLK